MTPAEWGAFVFWLGQRFAELLGNLAGVQTQVSVTAREKVPYKIETFTMTNYDLIVNLTKAVPRPLPNEFLNLGNVYQGIVALGAGQIAILEAIGSIPPPPTPPSVGEIAGGVWDAIDPFSRDHATAYGAEQASPWDWTDLLKAAGSVPAKHSPFFNVSYPPPIPD